MPEEDLLDNFLCRLELNIYEQIKQIVYLKLTFNKQCFKRDRAATIPVLRKRKHLKFSNIEMRISV